MTGKWSECSVTCGGGFQSRAIYCVESHNDQKGFNENLNVAEKYCWQKQRPVWYFIYSYLCFSYNLFVIFNIHCHDFCHIYLESSKQSDEWLN